MADDTIMLDAAASPSAASAPTEEEIETLASLLSIDPSDSPDPSELEGETDSLDESSSSGSASSCSSSSSASSSRPSSYGETYSHDDLEFCVNRVLSSGGKLKPETVSSEYGRNHAGVYVPPNTIRSRVIKLASNPLLTFSASPQRGSPLLTSVQRKEFVDWVLSYASACLCLPKTVLNVKVMLMAELNGHKMKKPPSRHWWRSLLKEVFHLFCLFLSLSFFSAIF
jgi:hypothetical protein